jgi:hypothetical protein
MLRNLNKQLLETILNTCERMSDEQLEYLLSRVMRERRFRKYKQSPLNSLPLTFSESEQFQDYLMKDLLQPQELLDHQIGDR